MKSQSFNIENVYIHSIGTIVGRLEKQGPLGKYFNNYIEDYYYETKSFEKAQIKMTKASIVDAINKSSYTFNDIKIAIAGDLSNQIFSSTSAVKEMMFPFVGIYAACASGILAIILASIYMNQSNNDNALVYTSSHVCVSQRQFRYPNEYAILCKESTTKTVTSAVSLILSKNKEKIKINKATIGKIVDVLSNNVNDLGSCMAYAAIDTFLTHLENNKESLYDYDLIVTGDLGELGSKIFVEELNNKYEDIKEKYVDCGCLIYDDKKQKTMSGGSGPGCVMAVTFSYIYKLMEKGLYKKILVIATGALHSQISIQQKETIPCIAHAITLEVEDDI